MQHDFLRFLEKSRLKNFILRRMCATNSTATIEFERAHELCRNALSWVQEE